MEREGGEGERERETERDRQTEREILLQRLTDSSAPDRRMVTAGEPLQCQHMKTK
jgi:hypothetical protein